MKQLIVLAVAISALACSPRKSISNVDIQKTKSSESYSKSVDSKDTLSLESTASKKARIVDSTSVLESSSIKDISTLNEQSKLINRTIYLKNNGDIKESQYVGNLVLKSASGEVTMIPISSNTELKIEDSKENKSKESTFTKEINSLNKKLALATKEIDSIVALKALAAKKLKYSEDKFAKLESYHKNKIKETENKGIGAFGYFSIFMFGAIFGILAYLYLSNNYIKLWKSLKNLFQKISTTK